MIVVVEPDPERARRLRLAWAPFDVLSVTGTSSALALARYPGGETSTYTAAAVVLAADALSATSPASSLFTDHTALPELLDPSEPVDRPTD